MISLGCPKNLVDSEVMLGLAQEQGHQLTRDAADADVLIVNTCAFIDKAKQESIDTIPEMDAILGAGEVPEIVNAIGARDSGFGIRTIPLLRSNGEQVGTKDQEPRTKDELPTYLYDASTPRLLATPRHYALSLIHI